MSFAQVKSYISLSMGSASRALASTGVTLLFLFTLFSPTLSLLQDLEQKESIRTLDATRFMCSGTAVVKQELDGWRDIHHSSPAFLKNGANSKFNLTARAKRQRIPVNASNINWNDSNLITAPTLVFYPARAPPSLT